MILTTSDLFSTNSLVIIVFKGYENIITGIESIVNACPYRPACVVENNVIIINNRNLSLKRFAKV